MQRQWMTLIGIGGILALSLLAVLSSARTNIDQILSEPNIVYAQTGQDSEALSQEELMNTGEQVYAEICSTCHQPEGQGSGAYPPLAGNEFVTSEDPTGVIETIVHGRGSMPSFGDQLSNEQIAGVATFIRNSWENSASAVQLSEVQAVTGEDGAAQQTDDQQTQDQEAEDQEATQAADQQAAEDQQSEQDDQQEQPAQTQTELMVTAPANGAGPIQIQVQIVVVTPTPGDQQAADDQQTAEATMTMTPTPADDQQTDDQQTEDQQAAETPEATPAAEEEATPTATPTTEPAADGQTTEEEDTAQEQEDAAQEDDTQTSEATAAPSPMIGSAVTPTGSLPGEPSIQLVKVAEGLIDPINLAYAPDGSGRIFVVERIGRIRIIQDGQLLEEPFLDITDLMETDFLEQGLLGVAFHPNYSENGRFFVNYTDNYTNGDTYIVEFSVSEDDPNVADPNSIKVLLRYEQPYRNHNGGEIHFGPDGYLYWSAGDGGLAGDSLRNAQNLENLLGTIARIDVNVDPNLYWGYTIPEDNPFLGRYIPSDQANEEAQDGDYIPDARPEIWAYGLRNPWQFSFDRETGDMYIADVGQAAWEEINWQPADAEGGINYGWPLMEGSHCFGPEETALGEDCYPFGTLPVAEYANPDMGCSITGIGIYRGDEFESLNGIYFSADYCSGRFFGLRRSEDETWDFASMLQSDLVVTGGGEDEAGNLYVTTCTCQFGPNYDPYTDSNGQLWRIVDANQIPEGAETAPLRE